VGTIRRRSWREKLTDSKGLPKTGRITRKMTKRWGSGTMVVPAPLEVDAIMRRVPKGKLITINEIRAALAKKHGVDVCCPITTGIFAWIAAHAAAEAEDDRTLAAKSRAKANPYWRTLKSGGELNPKYPGGIAQLRKLLVAEGHTVVPKGKRFFVAGFETCLASVQ
jgi:alkylated DNA nucleotide flippase Atl1